MQDLFIQAKEIIDAAKHIVILQADNPDGDSLSSALALESILQEYGKQTTLVCAIDMPAHLQYLSGWDRIEKDIPNSFDATILVDASTVSLLETLDHNGQLAWAKSKPFLVLDHHATTTGIDFATTTINLPAVSTGEVIYDLATSVDLPLPLDAMNNIVTSIMSDSLGLTTDATTAHSIHIVGNLVEAGVNMAELDAARRELMKREAELLPYKGKLLQRVRFFYDNSVAIVEIPWEEIEEYSHKYNPSMLALDDMRMTIGVSVAIAFKLYHNGRITAKIRCNPSGPIADKLAEHFGGGGHKFAAGFKILNAPNYEDVKNSVIKKAAELLKEV